MKAASYPDEWSREYQGHQNYWYRYTLNDDLMPDLLGVLTLAIDIYGDDQYERAMRKAGDFLILAQMPEPQPAWAQQYNWDMQPIWARKFEPASITGGESQGAIRTLMEVYRRTGDRKYLKPIPRALAYLRRSQLPDGRLARFYELKTNRPLYFTRDYTLTHDDSDMPTHYGFKVSSRIDRLEREYEALAKLPADKVKPTPREAGRPGDSQVRRVIAALDDRGAWVTQDKLRFQPYEGPVIDMRIAVGQPANARGLPASLSGLPLSTRATAVSAVRKTGSNRTHRTADTAVAQVSPHAPSPLPAPLSAGGSAGGVALGSFACCCRACCWAWITRSCSCLKLFLNEVEHLRHVG